MWNEAWVVGWILVAGYLVVSAVIAAIKAIAQYIDGRARDGRKIRDLSNEIIRRDKEITELETMIGELRGSRDCLAKELENKNGFPPIPYTKLPNCFREIEYMRDPVTIWSQAAGTSWVADWNELRGEGRSIAEALSDLIDNYNEVEWPAIIP